jgi:hypothetical protein
MSRRHAAYRLVGAALITGVLVLSALADTLRLKDGSIIKGSILSFKDGRFTVAVGEGSRRREMTFFANEIESILFETPSASTSNRNASYTPNNEKPSVKVVTSDPITSNAGGSNNKPLVKPPVVQPANYKGSSTVKPVEWTVKVLADNTANGWTNTGWVVKKGQRVRIAGDGTVSLGAGRSSTPSGSPDMVDNNKLLKNVPTGALIAVIGDDNNDFIYIGAEREFTATRDGALFLGINEGNLDDNSGSFNVKVEIAPGS